MAVTLRVGMQFWMLRVLSPEFTPRHFKQDDAERQGRDSHAEHGNQIGG